MPSLCVIRTHRWTEEEQRLSDQLRPVFGDDLVVAFHNRPADLDPGLRVADFNDDWVVDHGLRQVPDYGWRCGDYALYAARETFPGYEHYWIVEPDVYFSAPAAPFFAAFDNAPEDLLGLDVERFPNPDHRFVQGMGDMDCWRATFALLRVSGRALDRLAPARVAYSASEVRDRDIANDEVFCFSHIHAWDDMTLGRFETHAPEWVTDTHFLPSPEIMLDFLQDHPPETPKVMHPVLSHAHFLAELQKRLNTRGREERIIDMVIDSIVYLTEPEIAAICDDARAKMYTHMIEVQARHARKQRRSERAELTAAQEAERQARRAERAEQIAALEAERAERRAARQAEAAAADAERAERRARRAARAQLRAERAAAKAERAARQEARAQSTPEAADD